MVGNTAESRSSRPRSACHLSSRIYHHSFPKSFPIFALPCHRDNSSRQIGHLDLLSDNESVALQSCSNKLPRCSPPYLPVGDYLLHQQLRHSSPMEIRVNLYGRHIHRLYRSPLLSHND